MTDDWIARAAATKTLQAELATLNRTALFDALATAGITSVTVEFNGYGDEGQIESTEYFVDQVEITPTINNLMFTRQIIPEDIRSTEPITLEDAVDELLYDLLTQYHEGWQDGEGSYGEFTFDMSARTLDLSINVRFVDSNNYQHRF